MTDTMKPRCTSITPIIPVNDLGRALNFYTKRLGFTVQASDEGYAYIVRDEIALRLLTASDDHPKGEQACYICVENIDGLFDQMKVALEGLPEGRLKAPFNQPYGQREFHVIDEDSVLIFFGEPASN